MVDLWVETYRKGFRDTKGQRWTNVQWGSKDGLKGWVYFDPDELDDTDWVEHDDSGSIRTATHWMPIPPGPDG